MPKTTTSVAIKGLSDDQKLDARALAASLSPYFPPDPDGQIKQAANEFRHQLAIVESLTSGGHQEDSHRYSAHRKLLTLRRGIFERALRGEHVVHELACPPVGRSTSDEATGPSAILSSEPPTYSRFTRPPSAAGDKQQSPARAAAAAALLKLGEDDSEEPLAHRKKARRAPTATDQKARAAAVAMEVLGGDSQKQVGDSQEEQFSPSVSILDAQEFRQPDLAMFESAKERAKQPQHYAQTLLGPSMVSLDGEAWTPRKNKNRITSDSEDSDESSEEGMDLDIGEPGEAHSDRIYPVRADKGRKWARDPITGEKLICFCCGWSGKTFNERVIASFYFDDACAKAFVRAWNTGRRPVCATGGGCQKTEMSSGQRMRCRACRLDPFFEYRAFPVPANDVRQESHEIEIEATEEALVDLTDTVEQMKTTVEALCEQLAGVDLCDKEKVIQETVTAFSELLETDGVATSVTKKVSGEIEELSRTVDELNRTDFEFECRLMFCRRCDNRSVRCRPNLGRHKKSY